MTRLADEAHDLADAQDGDEPRKAMAPQDRKCLDCLRPFRSQRFGQRICKMCRRLRPDGAFVSYETPTEWASGKGPGLDGDRNG